jgi:hypothetical protein
VKLGLIFVFARLNCFSKVYCEKRAKKEARNDIQGWQQMYGRFPQLTIFVGRIFTFDACRTNSSKGLKESAF